ncbi:MAG: BCCT family transporter [Candidatus Aminicenantes bacterium]
MEEEKTREEKRIYTQPTFLISLFLMVIFVMFGVVATESLGKGVSAAFDFMVKNLGWSFILGVCVFLFLIIYLLLSPLGKIKLGKDEEKPAYSNLPWFAMLFSCGMGIGLLFWGVSEPIWHYMWPPYGEANTSEAVHVAMRYAFFHWGFHPWAIYAVVAGSLAYFSYRRRLPMLLSSTLEPILGREKIHGGWATMVNVIGVFATLFGLATSLGLGAMQIGSGLESLLGIPSTAGVWVVIVVVITAVAVISTVTGINRGIKYLAQFNIIIAALLMGMVLVVGPTLFILRIFTNATGEYLQNILQMSFHMDPAGTGSEGWTGTWTIFYWAWWIAWAPFVGTFIARISRGRTIRNFIIGVLLVPTGVSLVWFSVFGGSALFIEHLGAGGIADAVSKDSAAGFFAFLSTLPVPNVLIAVAMLSVAVFFITSLNSGTYVNSMLTSHGNPNPPVLMRFIWGILEGAIAAVLLFSGGLEALQTASVVGGFPFMIIMFLMLYCLFKALRAQLKAGPMPPERETKKSGSGSFESVNSGMLPPRENFPRRHKRLIRKNMFGFDGFVCQKFRLYHCKYGTGERSRGIETIAGSYPQNILLKVNASLTKGDVP